MYLGIAKIKETVSQTGILICCCRRNHLKGQIVLTLAEYGKALGGIREYLANIDGTAAMAELKEKGNITFTVGDTEVVLAEEDLLIETKESEDFVSEGDNTVTVVIDKRLTPELIEEGFVREIISKIQSMRKEADFNVMDRIKLFVKDSDKIADIIAANEDKIKTAVLADEVVVGEADGFTRDWNINGEDVTLGVKVNE